MRQKVIVIGHGYTSRLSVIRSVAEIGCDVTIISMEFYKPGTTDLPRLKPIDGYSKYVSNIYYCYRNGEVELIDLLLTKCKDESQKPILIPDTDFTAATIDKYKDILSPHFLFPSIKEGNGSMVEWMDKVKQKDCARKIGLNVASTSNVIEIKNGGYSIPSNIKYPCFTKPLATIKGGKGGMRRCDNEAELSSAVDVVVKRVKDAHVLVEDFMPIDKEYAVLGFSDGTNVIIPGAIQQVVVSKANKGIAMTGLVMPADMFGGLIEQFKQFVLATGFVGIFDIDFYLSGSKYYFCEMNMRFGGSGYAITKMGVNLPAMLVYHLRCESIGDMPTTFNGTSSYVNERMCMDDWQHLHISTKQFRKYTEEADISFIKDKKDPDPHARFMNEFKKNKFKHFVKLCLRKVKLR